MTTEEAPFDNRPQISDNEIIERFGGIRPMAAKLGVAVTTVQGWKERGHIPAGRLRQIVASAATHGIDLGAGTVAPAQTGPTERPPASPDKGGTTVEPSKPTQRSAREGDRDSPSASGPAKSGAPAVETAVAKETVLSAKSPKGAARRPLSAPGVAWLALLLTLALGVAVLTRPYWESALYGGGMAGAGGADPVLAGKIAADLDAVQQTVARLDRSLNDRSISLEERVRALEAGGGEAGAAFAGQLSELDARMTELLKSLATLSGAMDQSARRLTLLESAQGQLPEPVRDELAKVATQLDRLQSDLERQESGMRAGLELIERTIGGLNSRVTELETRPIQTGEKIAALALAIGQLEAAFDSGHPYRPALDRLHALGGDDPLIADSRALTVLAPWADHGIPDRLALYRRYVAITPQISRALAATNEETWLDSVWNSLKGLVTIRRVGSDGELTRVSQAEIALELGDLAAAAAALDGGGSLGPEGDAWLALVKARIEAEREIETLYGQVIAPLAVSTDASGRTQ